MVEIKKVKLTKELLWNENPRDHDEESIEMMIDSFREYGFVNPPIYADVLNGVCAGNGRVLALLELQRRFNEQEENSFIPEEIEIDGGDWLVPIYYGIKFESTEQAKQFAVDENNMVIGGKLSAGTVAAAVWNIEDYFKLLKDTGPTVTVKEHDIGFIQSMVMQSFGKQKEETFFDDYDEFEEEKSITFTLTFSSEESKNTFKDYLNEIYIEKRGGNVTKGDALVMYIRGD